MKDSTNFYEETITTLNNNNKTIKDIKWIAFNPDTLIYEDK